MRYMSHGVMRESKRSKKKRNGGKRTNKKKNVEKGGVILNNRAAKLYLELTQKQIGNGRPA